MPSPFLSASWKHLIMANYGVDEQLLLPFLPNKTELDKFDGKIFVSLVGFMFENTKLMGFHIPFHVNFEEVNLRFYVRFNDNGQWKRGTVFIREIVPKRAISFVANTVYREKYCTKRMSHFFNACETDIHLGYHWKHQRWNKLEATISPSPVPMHSGSEEEFIAEHYWGYSKKTNNTTYEYNVQHPAWNIFPIKDYLIDCEFGALYGDQFASLENCTPNSVLVAEGSDI
ncbi:MAG TPA: DUF2071 domain-containing protein, partial [Ferruginibacter sp.]|nr:DUF2071 domain-containing protein [Ferruginibacter sp.]